MADIGILISSDPNSPSLSPIPTESLIVDQESAKELQCGICLQLLNKPRQCKNGHLFCLSCISQCLEKGHECPSCRCSLKMEELARSLFVEKHLRLLKVYCKNHFIYLEDKGWFADEEGCNETVTLENQQRHELICGYSLVPCKYSSNCGKIRKMNIETHETTCEFRPEMCKYCKADVQFHDMEEHYKVCGMVPLHCTKCNAEVTRSEYEAHSQDVCLEEEIACPFHDQGCTKRVLRKNLKEHIDYDVAEHLCMMKKSFDDQVTTLKTDHDREMRAKDERITTLEKMVRESGGIYDTRVDWRVKNYSTLRKKCYLQSEKFQIAGFTWFIGFYTDGDNPDSKGFISIYLFLDVAHVPKGKSISIEYVLRFVNHKDNNDSIKKEFKTTFPIKNGQGWGDRKAIKNTQMEQAGFLKDDTFYIEAEIAVKKVMWAV